MVSTAATVAIIEWSPRGKESATTPKKRRPKRAPTAQFSSDHSLYRNVMKRTPVVTEALTPHDRREFPKETTKRAPNARHGASHTGEVKCQTLVSSGGMPRRRCFRLAIPKPTTRDRHNSILRTHGRKRRCGARAKGPPSTARQRAGYRRTASVNGFPGFQNVNDVTNFPKPLSHIGGH